MSNPNNNICTEKVGVLVPISFHLQIRYLIRSGLLETMNEYCNPIVALSWEQEDIKEELRRLNIDCIYFTDIRKPDLKINNLKTKIDNYFDEKILKTTTHKIRQIKRYSTFTFKKKIKEILKRSISNFLFNESKYEKSIKEYKNLLRTDSNFELFKSILHDNKISYLLTTAPFMHHEAVACVAAESLSIDILYSVISFDNITTRGCLPFNFSHFFVWNEINKKQIQRFYRIDISDRIHVVGPVQFDFYFREGFIKRPDQWRRERNLPQNRKIILYGANVKYWFPGEHKIIKIIDQAITAGLIIGRPIILLRPHPTDSFKDWEEFSKTCMNVYVEKSIVKNESEDKMYNKYSNFTLEDVKSLCSSLMNTNIHISYCSTLSIDGICFDKPQINIYFSPDSCLISNHVIRSQYQSEHFQPVFDSKAIELPKNIDELIISINQSFTNPNWKQNYRREILNDFVGKGDGLSMIRLSASIKSILHAKYESLDLYKYNR